MSLIKDFWLYCQSYEIPRNYAIWAALGLMGAAVNRRIFIRRGDLIHHANIYTCLVGEQGNKKSTCNDWARDFFTEAYDDIPVSSSVQSREQIAQFMASEDGVRTYMNYKKELTEYHPFMMFVNEFEQWLSFNPSGMISFLVDIYDRNFYDAGTIKRGLEKFPNPAVNLLACCTPAWLTEKLRGHVFSGGICRRVVFVVEDDAKNADGSLVSIAIPKVTDEARAAKQRVIDHLRAIKPLAREFQWDPVGRAWFEMWYDKCKQELIHEQDPFIRGFRRSMDTQLLKAVMLVDAASPNPNFLVTRALLEECLEMIHGVMPNMSKLSVAAGRNPLAGPQQEILEKIRSNNGMLPEKTVRRLADTMLSPFEIESVIMHLKASGRLILAPVTDEHGTPRQMLILEETYRQMQKSGQIKLTKHEPNRPSNPNRPANMPGKV